MSIIKNFFYSLLDFVLSLFPDLKPFDVLTVPELVRDIVTSVSFFLPLDTIFAIFTLSIGVTLLRFSISTFRLFKEFTGSLISDIFTLFK